MDLVALYKEGFAPGPLESVDSFKRRVQLVKNYVKSPPFSEKFPLSCRNMRALSPSFLTFESSKKLPFWFGAMTWIIEIEEGVKIAILQLPLKKRTFWVAEEEVVAHEKVHALRSAFEKEWRFEEILAYRTSKNRLRRFLGPLFQRPIESHLFLFASLLAIFSPLIPLLFFLGLFFRLAFHQWIFHKAVIKLSKETKNPEEVIRLFTDQEILLTAKGKFSQICKNSLRWEQIQLTREQYRDI